MRARADRDRARASKQRCEYPVRMFFNSVVRKNGFHPALARDADERLVVGRDVEIVVNDFGFVFGSGVEVYEKLDRKSIQLAGRIVR